MEKQKKLSAVAEGIQELAPQKRKDSPPGLAVNRKDSLHQGHPVQIPFTPS